MVSLIRNFNRSSSDSSVNMDQEEYLQPVLTSQEEENFEKLNTIPMVLVPVSLAVIIEIVGVIFVTSWLKELDKCNAYFIFVYLHCVYWLIILITDHFVKAKHHCLRIYGYLDFYQSTYQLIRTPLFIASLWMMAYLLLTAIFNHLHYFNFPSYCKRQSYGIPIDYIVVLSGIELGILCNAYIYYMRRVTSFNRIKPSPDVVREEWLQTFTQDSYAGSGEVGSRHRGSNVQELLEKQSDLIRYLKDHNIQLSHRMMLLASQHAPTEGT